MRKFNRSWLKSYHFVFPMLFALAGLGSTLAITTPAWAQTTTRINSNGTRVDVTLNRQPNESYDTLVGRAQAAARNALTRSFNQNPSAKRVSVTILGQNAGQIVPILALNVDRQTWASGQDLQRLATYFPTSRSLLGLRNTPSPNNNVANQPQPTNVATAGQTLPNGVRVLPNGIVVTGNGTQVLPNGVIVTNNGGTQVLPNGNVLSVNAGGQNASGNAGLQAIPGNDNATGTVFLNNTGVNGLNNTTGVGAATGTTGVGATNGINGVGATNGINGVGATNGINGVGATNGINGVGATNGIN
ncbi:hypothetical protein ACE1CI_11550, partial [Aerosakkonemataceae cyanobacterium BLCC-F50]